MPYVLVRIALSFCMEVLCAWTFTRVLTMRSNARFAAIYLTAFLINSVARELGAPANLRAPLSAILCDIGIPVLMSMGRLDVRLRRTLLINFDIILTELLGSTVYAIISNGTMVPATIGPDNIASVVIVYSIILLVAAPLFQITVANCNHFDGIDDFRYQLPVIALMVGTFLLFNLTYLRFCENGSETLVSATLSLAFCWTSMVITYLIFSAARRETEARLEISERSFMLRQAKHERTEIEAIAKRATDLYQLRHALANQMRTIARLAESGRISEVDQRLSDLQLQAHTLGDDSHE